MEPIAYDPDPTHASSESAPAPSPPLASRLTPWIVITAVGISAIAAATFVALRPGSRPDAPEQTGGHWPAVHRGRRLLETNRPDLALQTVSGIRDEAPGAGEAMCVAGIALAQMEQYRGARLALERALKLQPKQPMAAKALAALHLSLGDSNRGVECLRQAAELAPKDFGPRLALGRVYLDLGEPAEAVEAFTEACRLNPENGDARLGQIEALLACGRAEDARTIVAEALRSHPDDPKLLGLAARQAHDTGGRDDALALAEHALRVDPNEIEALLVRSRICFATERFESCLGDLERIVALNPNQLSAIGLLIQTESRLGLADRAARTIALRREVSERLAEMDELTKQIDSHPDDPEPRYRMGRLALEGHQSTLAANCFQAALSLDPKHRLARESLAALRPQSGAAPAANPASPARVPGGIPRVAR